MSVGVADTAAAELTRADLLRQSIAVALAAAGLLFLLGAGSLRAPVSKSAELRCLDIVRGVQTTGEWLVPRREGEPWIHKPPLYAWTAAALGRVGVDPLVALRSTSLVSAVALALVTFGWAARRRGELGGLLAMGLLASMPLFQSLARCGVAEMLLALSVAGAWLGYLAAARGSRRGLPLWALSCGVALLTKATMAVLLIAVPILVDLGLRKRLRAALSPRALGWTAASVAPAVGWYVAVLVLVPGARELLSGAALLPLGVSSVTAADHSWARHYAPVHAQLVSFVLRAAPVTLLLPAVVARARRTRGWSDAPELRFAAVAVGSLLVALTLLPQKQDHYLLPLLAPLAVLVADALPAVRAPRLATWLARRASRIGASVGVSLLGAGASLACWAWLRLVAVDSATPWLTLALGLGWTGFAAGAAARGRRADLGLAALVGWLCLLGVDYGSVDVWQRAFKVGAQSDLAGYDAARWDALRSRPRLGHVFETDPKWVAIHRDLLADSEDGP